MPNYQPNSKRFLWLIVAIPLLLSGCYATVRARPDYYGYGYYDRPYGGYYYAPPPRGVVVVDGHHGHWEHQRDYYRAPRAVEHRHEYYGAPRGRVVERRRR